MSFVFWIRAFAFLGLPLLLAAAIGAVDRTVSTRERRLEIVLIYLFAFGAAGSIAGAMGHFFASDLVAAAIGWPAGSPFQLEMGFANLAMGVLAAVAVARRDGFRDATVIGGAVLSIGAFLVHAIDIAQHGNLAPGNVLINITNLGRSALLIFALSSLRHLERSGLSQSRNPAFARWQARHAHRGGLLAAGAGTGHGIGMAVTHSAPGLLLSLCAGLFIGLLAGGAAVPRGSVRRLAAD